MTKPIYYDGAPLLSMRDLNGERPELFLCTTNRSGGKTTYFSRLCCNRFFNHGEKFAVLNRYNYELDDIADKFYKDVGPLFFPGTTMTSQRRAAGIYHELFIDGVSCGYALSLNSADQLKKYAHLLSDTMRMFFDEFQSETNHYCNDEVKKLISIHTSVARGQGEIVRYVPVYMTANPVTVLNPYYIALGITDRLRDDTRFLRGDGWVLEQGYVEAAAAAQKQSAFNRAFASNAYVAYAAESVYLNDNTAFVEKPRGSSRYLCTLRYSGADYAVREFPEAAVVYCDDRPDPQFKGKITVDTADHSINYVMLKRNDFFLSSLRWYFEHGCFRFKNIRCKEAVLRALSY